MEYDELVVIIIGGRNGIIYCDDFNTPPYFNWEEKTKEEQKQILKTRRSSLSYFEIHTKIPDKLYRKMFGLTALDPICMGTIKTLKLKRHKSERVPMIDYGHTPNLVQ